MKETPKNKKIPDLSTYEFDTSTYVHAFSFSRRDVSTGRLGATKKTSKLNSKKSSDKKG